MRYKFLALFVGVAFFNPITGISQITRPISTAVPFLTISPDSRAASMGDAGVASSPDANSIYWNTAKLAFSERSVGASVSYTPWLQSLVDDMGLINASFFKKINKNQAFTFGLTYFNLGKIEFTSNTAQSLGTFQSREFAGVVGYTRKLSRDFSMGINLKFINSNLIGTQVVMNQASKPGSSAGGDIGFYYNNNMRAIGEPKRTSMAWGLVFSNLGAKINYGRDAYFLPANIKLGTALTIRADEHNRFSLLVDANKLLVPTPNGTTNNSKDVGVLEAVFKSFNDAPDGMKEELKEITTSVGFEYMYDNVFAVRAGYFYESKMKGDRQYATVGLGFKLKDSYGLDMAYLIPTTVSNPLANTWRLSLIFDLQGKTSEAVIPAN